MTELELKLPDDVLESIPSSKEDMVKYLSQYFESVIDQYNSRFQKRVQGAFGGPLSKYERSILKDFLIDVTIGNLEIAQPVAAETITSR